MIRSAVTLSLVSEARGGPFVFWDDLPQAIDRAAELGFDALEVFAPGPDAISPAELGRRLRDAGLGLAAIGTGAGWVKHRLTLTDPDPRVRSKACAFVRSMIEWGAAAGIEAQGAALPAPAIIGSMQGRFGGDVAKESALGWLADALNELAAGLPETGRLLIEPLNRYETNLLNTLADGSALLRSLGVSNVRLLADLFHMNIEEVDSATALAQAGVDVGHLHFVDSNRRPAGSGHLDLLPIAKAILKMGYDGYASAEALPWPNPDAAATQTIRLFRRLFPRET
ncbi:MAG: sugar phosphate isomerase/epimerase [Planctomyces sp.]|nr:sugar phosphate isomerase/epimerase [Planctomyces sp.]